MMVCDYVNFKMSVLQRCQHISFIHDYKRTPKFLTNKNNNNKKGKLTSCFKNSLGLPQLIKLQDMCCTGTYK